METSMHRIFWHVRWDGVGDNDGRPRSTICWSWWRPGQRRFHEWGWRRVSRPRLLGGLSDVGNQDTEPILDVDTSGFSLGNVFSDPVEQVVHVDDEETLDLRDVQVHSDDVVSKPRQGGNVCGGATWQGVIWNFSSPGMLWLGVVHNLLLLGPALPQHNVQILAKVFKFLVKITQIPCHGKTKIKNFNRGVSQQEKSGFQAQPFSPRPAPPSLFPPNVVSGAKTRP